MSSTTKILLKIHKVEYNKQKFKNFINFCSFQVKKLSTSNCLEIKKLDYPLRLSFQLLWLKINVIKLHINEYESIIKTRIW